MVMSFPASNKVAEILEKSKRDVLDTLQDAIANINEETEIEKRKEFTSNFIEDCNKIKDKFETLCDFIHANQDDSKFKEKCQNSFKDIMMMISLYDECKERKDLKYDTFAYLASSYGIRHSEAMILYAATCMNIETLRKFTGEHMHLMKFNQAPASASEGFSA